MHLGQRDKAPGAPPVNYFCDVSRIILGSVNGAPIGGTALPGPRKTAYHVTTICLRIYGSYQIFGRKRNYTSTGFEWINTETGHRWFYGPIAHEKNTKFICDVSD
jgi:hypothetical protein